MLKSLDQRWLLCLLSGLLGTLLVSCASEPVRLVPKVKSDSAPNASDDQLRRLAQLPDPSVVEVERSRYGNGPVYRVLGKSYRVMDNADGFAQEGLASWYGTKFHGRRTSSGEPFDMFKLTAAHKHLPLPTYVRVTNLANGKNSVVLVNDRGPFHGNRIIDLSYAAAVKLGFHQHGTAKVRIEVLEPEPEFELEHFIVQAGAFTDLQRADRVQTDLAALTGLPGVVVAAQGLYRVHLGPVLAGADVARVKTLLKEANYEAPQLIPTRVK